MRFIEAGCEVILHCNGTLSERTQVAQPAGEMSDIAQKRAIRAVKMRKTPDMIDIAVLDAKLKALLSGGALAQ
jgi:beta-N-acetylhexosaminidase